MELNRAVAVAMRDGADAGLALVNGLFERGELADYYLVHAVRGRPVLPPAPSGRGPDAAYRRALELVQQAPERRFLERRLAALFDGNM